MRLAIDLTPPIAARPSGMQALVQSYLRSLQHVTFRHIDVTLLVSSGARLIYAPHSGDFIKLRQTTAPENIVHTFDAIHFPFNTLTFDPGNTPSIVTIHDLIPEHFPDQFDPAVRKQMRYACKRANTIITDSEFTRRDVIRRYQVNEKRVQCVYGTLHPVFHAKLNEMTLQSVKAKYDLPDRFLFYPAAARPHKNHEVILKALPDIDPEVCVVFTTGEIHLPERFTQLRRNLPPERVLALGHIDHADLPAIYTLAETVVIPSLGEGFGYPALEALTIGTPVIHSNAMSLSEIVGNAGLTFNPYDPSDLAIQVNRVLQNNELRRQIIEAGKEQAQSFNEPRTAADLIHAYKAAVTAHKRSPNRPKRLNVAFDVWRLAFVHAHNLRPTGITTYVQAIYDLLHESQHIELIPTIFPDPTDDHVYRLNSALDDPALWYGREVSRSWETLDRLSNKVARAGLEHLIHRLPDTARGKYRLRQWQTRFEPRQYRTRPFDSVKKWDIYHSPVNALPSPTLTGNTPRLLTVHDCTYVMFPELWQGSAAPPLQYALDSILPEQDYVVCDSEATRRDVLNLVNIAPERVFTVHLAADPTFNSPQEGRAGALLAHYGVQSDKYVLMLAQPEPRKNLIQQVRAFHKFHADEQFDDYQLVLISSNIHSAEQLQSQLEGEGLFSDALHIISDVDGGLLSGLYGEAGLFLYASLYEGFGIPVLEAMRSGCPVVTSPVSSLTEVGGEAVQYVDPHSPDAIADGLRRVLGDEAYRDGLITAGKAHASMFSWQRTLKETVAVYRHILEQSHQ